MTFLLVFLIQHGQNRELKAVHLKLDELIFSAKHARNELIHVEQLTEEQLDLLGERYSRLAAMNQESLKRSVSAGMSVGGEADQSGDRSHHPQGQGSGSYISGRPQYMIHVEAMASRRLLMSYAAAPTQDGGRLVGPAAGIDRDDRPPGLEFALIVLGLMLRDARTHEGTDEPGDAGPGRRVGEDDSQGSRRDGGTDDGDHARQDAEPGEGT